MLCVGNCPIWTEVHQQSVCVGLRVCVCHHHCWHKWTHQHFFEQWIVSDVASHFYFLFFCPISQTQSQCKQRWKTSSDSIQKLGCSLYTKELKKTSHFVTFFCHDNTFCIFVCEVVVVFFWIGSYQPQYLFWCATVLSFAKQISKLLTKGFCSIFWQSNCHHHYRIHHYSIISL